MSGQEAALFVLPSCSINTVFSFSRGGLSGNFCNTKKNEFYRFSLTTKRSSLRFIKCQVSNSAWKSWFRRLQLWSRESVCQTQLCWWISVPLPETSANGGHWSSAGSKLCLHESFAVWQGKPHFFHKISTTCHLLSFSTAPTFLAGFPGEQCTRIVHTAALTGGFSPCRPLFCTSFGILTHPARADTEPQSPTCLNYWELLQSSH